MILAHIRQDGVEQSLREHCAQAAVYAQKAMEGTGLEKTAYLAGLLHDMGKAKQAFSQYLMAAFEGEELPRGSVNHTFAAVRFLLDRWHTGEEIGYEELTAELLAAAVGSHHGLFDCIDPHRNSGFLYRQSKENIGYEESLENYLSECASLEELDALFRQAVSEITAVMETICALSKQDDDEEADRETAFYAGMLVRLLTSAVIEGDRKDTAEFMNSVEFPAEEKDLEHFWKKLLVYMEGKLDQLPRQSPIDQARRRISDACAQAAYAKGGVYRLNVPTGGGKTLSALRYALTHGAVHHKKRIIFTSPLLSILEQNAKVIRDYIGEDGIILEHHSNVIQENRESEETERLDLWVQTWDAPIIITTLVQLLNTCFSGKTGAIRRFHSLCSSIIVIDEVQTVPGKLLTMFNLAVNFLSEICGAAIILCSATQPELGKADHPLIREPAELVPWQEELWRPFRRTNITNAGNRRLAEIPELVEQTLRSCQSLLVVCNTKAEARFLFENLPDCRKFYLSADMCVKHRRKELDALETALREIDGSGEKLVCISTQVIEAGVDISFQQVIRLLAGMDSVVQAAGRCNRHGEQPGLADVQVVDCTDENLSCLAEIRMGKDAATSLLTAFAQDPGRFHEDLSGREAIGCYYRELYRSADAGYQDNVVPEHGSMYCLLSDNCKYADENCQTADRFYLRQAFRVAGRLFQVFDENTTEILVPYGAGRDIREKLLAADAGYGKKDWDAIGMLIQQAREYCISVYQHQWNALQEQGAVMSVFDGRIHILSDGYYDEHTGFFVKNGISGFQEV